MEEAEDDGGGEDEGVDEGDAGVPNLVDDITNIVAAYAGGGGSNSDNDPDSDYVSNGGNSADPQMGGDSISPGYSTMYEGVYTGNKCVVVSIFTIEKTC